MPKFIRLNVIHPNNIEADTEMNILATEIISVNAASVIDKRQRSEIQSVVGLRCGVMYAVTNHHKTILSDLEMALL